MSLLRKYLFFGLILAIILLVFRIVSLMDILIPISTILGMSEKGALSFIVRLNSAIVIFCISLGIFSLIARKRNGQVSRTKFYLSLVLIPSVFAYCGYLFFPLYETNILYLFGIIRDSLYISPWESTVKVTYYFNVLASIFLIPTFFISYNFRDYISSKNTQKVDKASLKQEIYQNLISITDKTRADRIIVLNKRSKTLIIQSYLLLVVIVGIVISVGYFIPIAGEIAGQDVTATNAYRLASTRIDKLRNSRDKYIAQLATIETDTRATHARMDKLKSNTAEPKIESKETEQQKKEKQIEQNKKKKALLELENRLAALEREKNTYIEQLADSRKDLEVASKLMPSNFKELEDGLKGDSESRLLISANVTRFGVLTLSIYLVQILINLFRFNTRLAAYYRSVADSLTLYKVEKDEIGRIIKDLAPPFDYGKEPQHISKLLVKSITDASTKIVETVHQKAITSKL